MTSAAHGDTPEEVGARAVHKAFQLYARRFAAITHRARERFLARDWRGSQADAVARLDLYARLIGRLSRDAAASFGPRVKERELWAGMKRHYQALIDGQHDVELAETFFNSLTRRIFGTVGVNTAVEFVRREGERPHGTESVYTTFPLPEGHLWDDLDERVLRTSLSRRERPQGSGLEELVRRLLLNTGYPFADLESCTARATERIQEVLDAREGGQVIEAAELLDKGFYRGRAVYMVGRLLVEGERFLPLVLALRNPERGVVVDAVLTTEDELSILFSFARSPFRVDVDHVGKVLEFLRSLLPRKPLAELYNCLGFDKHGKTELYRQLLSHLETETARFRVAPGVRGMVMIVFVVEGMDLVFKVIRDRFAQPKTATREHVKQRYRLVFRHDRAGRLVDAQEFEHLEFDRSLFDPELLAELEQEAAESVVVGAERVAIRHLYTERRLEPLDLHLRRVDADTARNAVSEYGWALRDLAGTNIFPGDLLLKNFGVTRHGRVIFYDYDELCLVTDCRFREIPPPRDEEDGWRAEPSFYVGDDDIFPEEFLAFLSFTPEQRRWFLDEHAELLSAAFWREMQRRHQAGEVIDIAPYHPTQRLGSGER